MTAPPDDRSPRVTTVVMTRDRWPQLQRSLPHHTGPVVLVDNASVDGTPELVAEHFPEVEVVALAGNRGAPARNIGVRRARTPYVAFADDDSWWAPGATSRAADVLDRFPRLGLLAARVLVGDAQREDPVCAEMAHSPLPAGPGLPGPPVLGFLACGAAVRREAYLGAGGFDDVVFFMGEEERLALDLHAAGWQLCYRSDVVAHHHPGGGGPDPAKVARIHRNRLLTTVMRRPWSVVAATAYDVLRAGRTGRAGLRAALPALPAAVRARRPLPPATERARRLLGR
ncbi:MAG: glycosyltransferase family 2 protein [Marmoricola sp.]